ncbi:MAG: hypothetical protein IJ308_04010 [Clostridia bacterium]|nr:hypothetical protein [Clostridia bacterium]
MLKSIKRSKDWYYKAYLIAYVVGLIFCVLPTVASALVKLPVIASKSAESTLSGVFIVALIAAALPLYKALVKLLKSPSVAVILWLFFAAFFLVGKMTPETINGLTTVFLWAAIGNTLGVIAFKLSSMWKELWQYCGEVRIRE